MSNLDQSFSTLLSEDIQKCLPSAGNAEVGLDAQEQTKALELINSTLAPLTSTTTLNPYYMVQRIQVRLAQSTGLTFDEAYFVGETGEKEIILRPVDNITVHNLSGQYTSDNPFLKMFPGGLRIKFQFVKVGTLYHVDAQVIPVPLPSPVPVTEKKEK